MIGEFAVALAAMIACAAMSWMACLGLTGGIRHEGNLPKQAFRWLIFFSLGAHNVRDALPPQTW
jgi:hypothetical protein